MGIKRATISLARVAQERSLRFDVGFVAFSGDKKSSFYTFSQLFELIKQTKDETLSLVNQLESTPFKYAEIGNVNNNGEVQPVLLNFAERAQFPEHKSLYKKIEGGDVIKASLNDILVAKTRPNLKKFVFIDKENCNFYYTEAFHQLRARKKGMELLLYYALRNLFHDSFVTTARLGKSGYPSLAPDDLLHMRFNKKAIDYLEKHQSALSKKIQKLRLEEKELRNSLSKKRRDIDDVLGRVAR